MGEAEIRFLKMKCNKLIDKALQLENEIRDKDNIIKQLQETKKELQLSIQEQKDKQLQEKQLEDIKIQTIIPEIVKDIPPEDKNEILITDSNVVTYEKVCEMIQTITAQMDNRPMEEIVVRKITFGGKVLELITDGIGKIIKVILIGGIMILLSLAATVLLNEELRNMLMEYRRYNFIDCS